MSQVGKIIIFVIVAVILVFTDSTSESNLSEKISSLEPVIQLDDKYAVENNLEIVDKPVMLTEYRKQLARDYANIHYGDNIDTITPKAIVIHWTATDSMQGVYKYFYDEEAVVDREYGKLNLASHFLVDKDGSIYRLTPEIYLNRHAIGLNWCSIGIENVGGENGNEDLTEAQLQANIKLVKYLKDEYPTINYLFGHYQQDYAKEIGLWKENIPDYYAEKIDPGSIFMQGLINAVKDCGFVTFPP